MKVRIEKDFLGIKEIPAEVYYGIHTSRALENFKISGIKPHNSLIRAMVLIKKSAAKANVTLKKLDRRKAEAIIKVCDEILAGKMKDQFLVDVFQAGAGTSFNMNINEVIANRAIEILEGKKGNYKIVHPNDDVNKSQSTNDTYPTAMRIAIIAESGELIKRLVRLGDIFHKKSLEFKNVIKSARTHLQDAVPITLGQEFSGYSEVIKRCIENISSSIENLKFLGIGGSASGTGINVPDGFQEEIIKNLIRYTKIDLKLKKNLFEAMQSMVDFSNFSGLLKSLAIELSKIANDLRFLSSGPNTGLNEISLPPVQSGSSIMPEVMNMVCFQVIGNDLTVTMASQSGNLELNVMMPVIAFNILFSMDILKNCVHLFTEKCVLGIKANLEVCKRYAETSAGLATVLNPVIGYEKAGEVVREALKTGKTIKEVVLQKGILSEKEWNDLIKKSINI